MLVSFQPPAQIVLTKNKCLKGPAGGWDRSWDGPGPTCCLKDCDALDIVPLCLSFSWVNISELGQFVSETPIS